MIKPVNDATKARFVLIIFKRVAKIALFLETIFMYISKSFQILVSLGLSAGLMLQACSSSKRTNNSAATGERPGTAIQKKFGTLTGVPPEKITNAQLYNFIDKWLNTNYKYGGQSEKEIDCSAFSQILYEAVYKKKLPRTSEAQYNASDKISTLRNLQEGDLVFFTTIKGKRISHVGIYLQNNRFVNATNKGVLISDMNLPYWRDSFVAGGRF